MLQDVVKNALITSRLEAVSAESNSVPERTRLSISLCMRQRVCMCLRIWACAGQGLISGIVFYRSPSYIFRQNHSVEPKAHGLASQLALGFPVFTVLRLQRGYHTLSAFMWVLGLTHRHSLFVLVPAVWSGLTLINLISSIKTLFFLRYRGLGLNHIFGGRKWDTLKSIIL